MIPALLQNATSGPHLTTPPPAADVPYQFRALNRPVRRHRDLQLHHPLIFICLASSGYTGLVSLLLFDRVPDPGLAEPQSPSIRLAEHLPLGPKARHAAVRSFLSRFPFSLYSCRDGARAYRKFLLCITLVTNANRRRIGRRRTDSDQWSGRARSMPKLLNLDHPMIRSPDDPIAE